jgi:hypothetical protein
MIPTASPLNFFTSTGQSRHEIPEGMYCELDAENLSLHAGRGGLEAKNEGWAGVQLPLPMN